MYSVDLAAWYYFNKNFPDADLTFAVLYPHKCNFGNNPIEYCSLLDHPYLYDEADLIVFWGDFLHAYDYRKAVTKQLVVKGYCATDIEARSQVRKYLFLTGYNKNILQNVIIYGGTLLFNDLHSQEDQEYLEDQVNLFKNCRRVWMRESFSAFKVQELLNDFSCSYHGTDCALFLPKDSPIDFDKDFDKTLKVQSSVDPQKIMAVFLGRSKMPCDGISKFISNLNSNLNTNLYWLNWGVPPFFEDKREDIFVGLPELANKQLEGSTPLAVLANLKHVNFIVSDTYHVCVNAWNLGIPALCIIDNTHDNLGVNSGSELGKRDKRVAFYWSYNASPYLLYSSDLIDDGSLEKKAAKLAELLVNKENINFIRSNMVMHADAMQSLIKEVINEIDGVAKV